MFFRWPTFASVTHATKSVAPYSSGALAVGPRYILSEQCPLFPACADVEDDLKLGSVPTAPALSAFPNFPGLLTKPVQTTASERPSRSLSFGVGGPSPASDDPCQSVSHCQWPPTTVTSPGPAQVLAAKTRTHDGTSNPALAERSHHNSESGLSGLSSVLSPYRGTSSASAVAPLQSTNFVAQVMVTLKACLAPSELGSL